MRTWLADKPALRELWAVKEAVYRLYRIRGHARAKRALTALTDSMARSSLPEQHAHALAPRGEAPKLLRLNKNLFAPTIK